MQVLPTFELRPSDGVYGKIDIQIQSPNFINFNKITLQIIPDKSLPEKSSNGIIKSKNKYIDHYYTLYGKEWIKLEAKANTNKGFKCLHCGKLYNNSSQLFSHINFHRNERLYKCSYCTLSYFSQKSLTWHVKKCHPDKVDWIYFCPICDKKYLKQDAFMRHLESESNKSN